MLWWQKEARHGDSFSYIGPCEFILYFKSDFTCFVIKLAQNVHAGHNTVILLTKHIQCIINMKLATYKDCNKEHSTLIITPSTTAL